MYYFTLFTCTSVENSACTTLHQSFTKIYVHLFIYLYLYHSFPVVSEIPSMQYLIYSHLPCSTKLCLYYFIQSNSNTRVRKIDVWSMPVKGYANSSNSQNAKSKSQTQSYGAWECSNQHHEASIASKRTYATSILDPIQLIRLKHAFGASATRFELIVREHVNDVLEPILQEPEYRLTLNTTMINDAWDVDLWHPRLASHCFAFLSAEIQSNVYR